MASKEDDLYYKDTLTNLDVRKYADGVGVHWYTDFASPPSILEDLENAAPDMFYLATEACILRPEEPGNWTNAELYVESIITDLNHGFVGWVDWNMALNLDSGPSWVHNQYHAPIMVNASAGEFHKNPTFYAMGHFSKFVIPGSVRVAADENLEKHIRQIGFLRPDGILAFVVMNSGDQEASITINSVSSVTVAVTLEPHSINTLLYKL